MADRDLNLNITADAEQAKAQLQATADAVKGVAGASDIVSTAAENARKAMGNFVVEASTGGKNVEVAFKAASVATTDLETAINKAKASRAPISQAAIDQLNSFRSALLDAAPALDKVGEDLGKVEAGHTRTTRASSIFRAETTLATSAMGPFGSSLRALSTSNDQWIASLAKGGIAIGAAIGAAKIFTTTLKDLNERGIDIIQFSELQSKAMDILAVAFGGTTKAVMESVKAFKDEQDKLHELDFTVRAFPTAFALFTAAGIDATKVFQTINDVASKEIQVLRDLSGGFDSVATGVTYAEQSFKRLNTEINIVRLSQPEAAKAFTESELALARMAERGQDVTKELAALSDQVEKAKGRSEEFSKTIEKMGPDAAAAFGTFSKAAQFGITALEALKSGGLKAEERFEALRGTLETVAVGYERFGSRLEKENPHFATQVKALFDIAKGHDLVTLAIAKHTKDLEAHTKTVSDLSRKYEDMTKVFELNRQKIIQHANEALAQAERQRIGVAQSLNQQMADLNAANRAGTISNADYAEQVNIVQGQQVEARRAAEAKTELIQQDEATSLAELSAKYKESSAAVVLAIAAQKETMDSAKTIQKAYEERVKDIVDQMVKSVEAHADATAGAQTHAREIKLLDSGLEKVAKGGVKAISDGVALTTEVMKAQTETHIPAHITMVNNLNTAYQNLNKTLVITGQLGSSLTITSSEGGEATPGSEGS